MKLFDGKMPTCLQIIERASAVRLDHTPKLFLLPKLHAKGAKGFTLQSKTLFVLSSGYSAGNWHH